MISAFGPAAERYAAGLHAANAIVTDESSLGTAFLEAVRRRERGEAYYGMILFEDRRSIVNYDIARGLITATPDPERCDVLLQQLRRGTFVVNGTSLEELWADPVVLLQVAREFSILADAMLVRSFAEYVRLANLFIERPPSSFERVLVEPALPAVAPPFAPARPGIVIWAPYRNADLLGLHAFTLANIHGEVTCVAAGGALPGGLGIPVLTREDARTAEVLARATCVVCVEPNDPGDAVAFARRGYGVVAPITSGAHEYVASAQIWDGTSVELLHAAVVAAIGRPAAVTAVPEPVPALAPVPAAPIAVADVPLVSIIMPTYNRRELLARVLSCVAAQTYPRVEAVVVNDAGVAVDDIVAHFPFARLVVHATNRGPMGASETGFLASRGEYVAFLPDDDWMYPDHLERLMVAIVRAGTTWAHSSALLRYFKQAADGSDTLRGFNMSTFAKTIDLREALVASTVSVNQCLQHRRVFDELGWFLNDNAVTDNEFHMRLLQHATPAFVPNVTCEFRDYERASVGKNADLGAALKRVYDEIHPFPDRPVLNDIRERTLASIAARPPGVSPFEPSVLLR